MRRRQRSWEIEDRTLFIPFESLVWFGSGYEDFGKDSGTTNMDCVWMVCKH